MKTLRGETADRVPVLATGAALAAQWAGLGWEEFRGKGHALAKAQLAFQQQTGLDWVIVYSDALAIPELLGCKIRLSPVSGPLVDSHFVFGEYSLPEDADFASCRGTAVTLEAVEICARATAGALPVGVLFEGPLTTALRVFEPSDAFRAMIKQPVLFRGLLEGITGVLVRFATAALAQGAAVVFIPEPFSSLDAISARHFREFSLPYLARLVDAVHQGGGKAILHMCGDTAAIWPEMVRSGADALSLDQKMSLAEARQAVGPETVLAGNVDPVKTLLLGKREDVRREASRCLQAAGPERFVLMPGCGVPPGTPQENLRELVAAARRYGDGGWRDGQGGAHQA